MTSPTLHARKARDIAQITQLTSIVHMCTPPLSFQEQRPLVAAEFPELPLKKMTSLIGERWAKLPEETKAIYHRIAEEKRREYDQALNAFYNTQNVCVPW